MLLNQIIAVFLFCVSKSSIGLLLNPDSRLYALCTRRVALSAPNNRGDSRLSTALELEYEDVAHVLGRHGVDTGCWGPGHEGCQQTLLHRAINKNKESSAIFVIRSQCDLDSPRQPGPNGERRRWRRINDIMTLHNCPCTSKDMSVFAVSKFDSSSIMNTVNIRTRGAIYVRKRRDNDQDDVKWSIINEEVDTVVPLVLQHLKKMRVEHLLLPDIKENISVTPLVLTYNTGIYLTNGIAYNLAGINRFGRAYMTYENGAFLVRFYLNVRNLQFEYDFLLKLLALEGHGKVIGSLEDTLVYMDLGIDVKSLKIIVYDFRVVNFRNIQVQLNEARFIRDLSGYILTPLTKLFKESITTSISDNLKEQMQMVMDDFNNGDPLELQKFVKQVLGGLTGNQNHTQ